MWLESSLSPDDDELGESCILWLYSYLSHADVVLSRRVCPGVYSAVLRVTAGILA